MSDDWYGDDTVGLDDRPADETAGITLDMTGDGIADYDTGDATVDVTGDGGADTSIVETGEGAFAFVDLTGDDVADLVVEIDGTTGEVTRAWEQQSDGTWDRAHGLDPDPDGGPDDHSTEPGPPAEPDDDMPDGTAVEPDTDPMTPTNDIVDVPDMFRDDEPPKDSPLWPTWHADEVSRDNTAKLWSWAHPGEPWPTDPTTGNPAHPVLVLGVIGADPEVDAQLRDAANLIKDQWNERIDTWVN